MSTCSSNIRGQHNALRVAVSNQCSGVYLDRSANKFNKKNRHSYHYEAVGGGLKKNAYFRRRNIVSMQTTKYIKSLFVIGVILIAGCGKSEEETETPAAPVKPFFFEKIVFTPDSAYFSTDGSFVEPLMALDLQTLVEDVDLTYIYSSEDDRPGFMDPITRSEEWSNSDFEEPLLSAGVRTLFYNTLLTRQNFEAAMADQTKIGSFLNGNGITVPLHNIFPYGTVIGGPISIAPASVDLYKGQVIGFWNYETNKKGLIFIRPDQAVGWPEPILNRSTLVDIVREK
jgi:hypothetical protein